MMDCKYFLPCGRCEKRGAACDCNTMPIEPPKCEHEWQMVGAVGGTKARYIVFTCSKCKAQQTEKIIFGKGGTYQIMLIDD